MIDDSRRAIRKVLKTRAQLSLQGAPLLETRTLDIGVDGVGMLLPIPVLPGQLARVSINMYFDGRAYVVESAVKVTFCVFSGGEFRAGFQFIQLEAAALSFIAKYLR